jgi:hypothetical protein
MDLNLESVVGITGLAFLGVLVTAWDRSRQTLFKLFGFIIQESLIKDGWLAAGIYDLQSKYGVRLKGSRYYRVYLGYAEGSQKMSHVLCRAQSGVMWLWYKKSLIAVTPDEKIPDGLLTLRYPRWVNIEKFLTEAMDCYHRALGTSFAIIVYRGTSEKESSTESKLEQNNHPLNQWQQLTSKPVKDIKYDAFPRDPKALDKLFLSQKAHETVKDILHWKDSRNWCLDKGIPWKRGYLLTGVPGTGKTSFVRAIAETLNIPVHILDLSEMTNLTFTRTWNQIVSTGKIRIILMEDFDNIFHGRENVTKTAFSSGVTFDCLLQQIDGVERINGTLVFITTNHPELLDPAIGGNADGEVNRAGRIDRVLDFPVLNLVGSMQIATKILGECLSPSELTRLAQLGVGMTGANFQEKCIRRAYETRFGPSNPSLPNGKAHIELSAPN